MPGTVFRVLGARDVLLIAPPSCDAALATGRVAKVAVDAAVAEPEGAAKTNDERQRPRSSEQPVRTHAELLGGLIDREQRVLAGHRLVTIGGDEACSHRALQRAQLRQQGWDPAGW